MLRFWEQFINILHVIPAPAGIQKQLKVFLVDSGRRGNDSKGRSIRKPQTKRWWCSVILAIAVSHNATAVDIQERVTTGGLSYYLVASDALPMLSLTASFQAGSAYEPTGQNGVAQLTASLLGEGAGMLDSTAFQQQLEALGSRFVARVGRTSLAVTMQMLSGREVESFDLLTLALNQPQFDDAAFDRIQAAHLAGLKQEQQSPGRVAGRLFTDAYFGTHPYGHMPQGRIGDVAALKVQDVRAYYASRFGKDQLVLSVVGKVDDYQQLERWLDQAFGTLPDTAVARDMPVPAAPTPQLIRRAMPTPQTAIIAGLPGITYTDPDYYPAVVMNHILGAGGFSSRLMQELREKRGLTYGVFSYLEPLSATGRWIVSVQTGAQEAERALALLRSEIDRMGAGTITAAELADAKKFLIGSFPLRLDSSRKILGQLTHIQRENLGADYLNKWSERIDAVTLADVNRVARRLMAAERLITVKVGGDE